MAYKIKEFQKVILKNPILVEGLPGIGNIGKIAVDFIIDHVDAKKILGIYSYNFPHAVFVNDKNLVELPVIELYHKRINGADMLFLVGDIQPIDESSCYEFCETVLNIFEGYKGKEIVTIGGIGLQQIPKDPKVYCTANDKRIIKKYQATNLNNLTNKIYGIVGPIIGVTGLLVGLAEQREIPAIAFLAETYGHPTYLGIKGSREVLKILNNTLNLKLNLSQLDEEIIETEKGKVERMSQLGLLQHQKKKTRKGSETDYIG